ncbi:SDR family NAD(P)-dependent oxidoreductase [Streptomyces sp. NPDC014724]|uniref:SDR family NAD(P)-dependent oxidoreductase n=1 Tax=unclassified Streptomyces TaxID=2593676 RepID=UPI0036F596E9
MLRRERGRASTERVGRTWREVGGTSWCGHGIRPPTGTDGGGSDPGGTGVAECRDPFVERRAEVGGAAGRQQDRHPALDSRQQSCCGSGIDILVNNAGIYPSPSTADTDEETFDRIYGVNVKAPFFLTAALAPAMIEAGGGAVINLGSWIARLGVPVGAVYSSSKGAMEALTRAWAAEFGPRGIRVNAISPGVVHTPHPDETGVHPGDIMMKGTPAGSFGLPDAIAQAAVYLASDEANFVHGTVLDVDGGRTGVAVIAQ